MMASEGSVDSKVVENNIDHDKRAHSRYVIFKKRQSPVDELFQTNRHFRGFALMSLVAVFYSLVLLVVYDSLKAGRLYLDTIIYDFMKGWGSLQQICTGVTIELVILMLGFLFYPLFTVWLHLRKVTRLFDVVFVMFYILCLIASFPAILWPIFHFELPGLISLVLTCEQLRICMKTYSFIRHNAYKVLYPWNKDDRNGPAVWYEGQMSPKVGSFSHYSYFLFCPTLLYRDNYPRNLGPIKWSKVVMYWFCCIIPIVVTVSFLVRFLHPETMRWTDLVHCLCLALPTGHVLGMLGMMCLMHGYMNMAAELTRFADREFYTDWWNSTIYTEFYRKWNIIPHHFIHECIYKDAKKFCGSRVVAMFVPLLVSSVIHEYIIGASLGHIFPLTTFLFTGFGIVVVFIWFPERLKVLRQLVLLGSFSAGFSMMIVGTIIEMRARQLCPRQESWVDFFLPRTIECFRQYNKI